MNNPKTTVSGYIGIVGSLLMSVGLAFQAKPWGQALLLAGTALSGANGVGNVLARDGSPPARMP